MRAKVSHQETIMPDCFFRKRYTREKKRVLGCYVVMFGINLFIFKRKKHNNLHNNCRFQVVMVVMFSA
ncbi:hypothetical protein HMPREF9123_1707 [Neisseria bacilliformis ATCC BAA-1200]|uniref:Uncharacterized protein n=1 Tax=Neisseria bacilliformis ATCC BAA-1200 TaxID=888742 RepID=F2BDA1_9NEIS|nr:hypothetical protein HMPREF9123_1707 [Neisseria bacilliformis ATCC BAA-1200]